jgi:CDP-diacylglycerol--glycerol-3-phosphate 3-phosphatidyltransferase
VADEGNAADASFISLRPLTAANVLTISRLVLMPVLVYCFLTEIRLWAFVIYCFASFTDLIDGSVARMFGTSSKSGALLDPIADKLLMQSTFLLLLISGYLPLWFYCLALLRDFMIVFGIIYLEIRKAKLPYRAIWPSKLATLFQMFLAGFALLRWFIYPGHGQIAWLMTTQNFMMFFSAIFILVSGYQYFQTGIQILRENRTSLGNS